MMHEQLEPSSTTKACDWIYDGGVPASRRIYPALPGWGREGSGWSHIQVYRYYISVRTMKVCLLFPPVWGFRILDLNIQTDL